MPAVGQGAQHEVGQVGVAEIRVARRVPDPHAAAGIPIEQETVVIVAVDERDQYGMVLLDGPGTAGGRFGWLAALATGQCGETQQFIVGEMPRTVAVPDAVAGIGLQLDEQRLGRLGRKTEGGQQDQSEPGKVVGQSHVQVLKRPIPESRLAAMPSRALAEVAVACVA